jgi:tetratricopeptide (TPR) repeat protein
MFKPVTFCFLLVFALLEARPFVLSAQEQSPAAPPPRITAQPAADPAPSSPAGVIPPPQPTPEELGDSLSSHQRYQAAIAAYAGDPHPSAAVRNKMGIAYQMMLNAKDAARCYRESLKLNPANASVWNNLATLYDSGKDYKNGEKNYRKAIKLDAHSAVFYKNLGTNLLAQHKYEKGWQAYQQALAIDPNIFSSNVGPKTINPSSTGDRGAMNYYMARGCVRTGQFDCAIEYLRMALNEGFTTAQKVSRDEDFTALRTNPAFQQLLADEKQQKPTNR